MTTSNRSDRSNSDSPTGNAGDTPADNAPAGDSPADNVPADTAGYTPAGDAPDILERNVSTLLESGGEPPRLAAAARARIKDELVARFAPTDQSVGNAEQAANHTDQLVGRSRKGRPAGRPLVAIGVGLVALAAGALIVGQLGGGTRGASTGVPTTELAEVALADGSTYVADRGAHVDVLGPRRVRVSGSVLFDVTPGRGTFTVETASGRVDVLGTRFVVDGETDQTSAAVVRGEVKLASASGDVTLHAGEQGIASAGKPPVRGPAPRLSHLVSWAREARREGSQEHPVHHGTLFARDPGVRSHPPWGEEYPLPLAHLGLDVVVEDQVARVALDQTFHNDQPWPLEGVYRFAVPPDAALQRLAMYNDGRLEEAAVVERMQARRIYEQLVYRRVDPALLEWAGTGRLSLRVYPIPANDDKRLVLAYTQSLPKLYDDWTLTIPLPETDQPVGLLDATVRVKGCANCELASPSHAIAVERSGDDAIVHYRQTGARPGDSFVLRVRDARHQTTVATKTDGADRYLMVRAPGLAAGGGPTLASEGTLASSAAEGRRGSLAGEYRPRTWVILDDVSASRGADELRAQRDLIDALVHELDENDRVAVIAFDVEAREKLAPTRVTAVDRRALRASLEREGGVGATDFQVALDAATKALAGVAPDDAMILYLGDGMITSGPRNLDALRAQIAGKAHFVGVGVGDGPDTQTLGTLAAATGGYATSFDLSDDLGWRAFDLVAALHTARVTDVQARLVDASGQTVPATAYLASPQLADGEELELVAKLAGGGTPTAIELTGTQGGAPWQREVPLGTPAGADAGYLPRLWAQRHIAARLLAKHEPVAVSPCAGAPCPSEADAREARDEQIRREVVALGKRYFLLSRHTSLLVLENDAMYAEYGVAKGRGDTWAPYALPARWTPAAAKPTAIAEAHNKLDEATATANVDTSATAAAAGSAATSEPEPAAAPASLQAQTTTAAAPAAAAPTVVTALPIGTGAVARSDNAKGEKDEQHAQADDHDATATPTPAMATKTPPSGTAARDVLSDRNANDRDKATVDESGLDASAIESRRPVGGDLGSIAHGDDAGGPFAKAADGWIGRGWAVRASAHAAPSQTLLPSTGAERGDQLFELEERRIVGEGGLEGDVGDDGLFRFGAIGHGAGTGMGYGVGRFGRGPGGGGDSSTEAGGGRGGGATWREHTPPVAAGWSDLTELVPALFPDAIDGLRAELAKSVGSHVIDPQARELLERARAALPSGVYRWGDRQVAVDARHQLAWRRTTDYDLAEVGIIDASEAALLRRYDELGLDIRTPLGDDDALLALADVPFWIADPAHYARYFDVKRDGNDIALYATGGAAPRRVLVLRFDAQARLVAVADGDGAELLAITWSATGPIAARRAGEPFAVGFSPEAIADASAWATAGTAPGVALALPGKPSSHWLGARAALVAGSLPWRDAERQLLVAAAAEHDGPLAARTFGELALHGGVELGDLALASHGLAGAPAQSTLGALAQTPLGRYVLGLADHPRAASIVAPGLVGALAQARAIVDASTNHRDDEALAGMAGLAGRAPALRLLAARRGATYDAKPAFVAAMWEACATGAATNTARERAALLLESAGHYDAAADEVRRLVDELDLTAAPPQQLASLAWVFQNTRGGDAAWQLAYAHWRDRVLAGDSFAHVVALAPAAIAHGDADAVLGKGAALVAGDPARGAQLARIALVTGQSAWVARIAEPLLAKTPTRELYQLAAQGAIRTSRPADALADLERAEDLPGDAEPIANVRAELGTILDLAQQLAVAASGPAREQLVARALRWGERWRAIDPGNVQTDRQLGELELAVGDEAAAWRELSTAIERDPWSSTGYTLVAEAYERQGKVEAALPYWQQAIVIDQTNPTPRLRKAQALIALGRGREGDELLRQITSRTWHDVWSNVVYQAQELERNQGQRSVYPRVY